MQPLTNIFVVCMVVIFGLGLVLGVIVFPPLIIPVALLILALLFFGH